MTPYKVELGTWHDEDVITLHDLEAGSHATIAYKLGANCVDWTIRHNDEPLAIIDTPLPLDHLRSGNFQGGVPILWPFPGRVRQGKYNFAGQTYQLPTNGGENHLHGLVLTTAWQISKQGTEHGAWVQLTLSSEDLNPELRTGYPFEFGLSLTFRLSENRLQLDFKVENQEKEREIPFGLGLHPYFRTPLKPSTQTPDRAACQIKVPAAKRWPTQDGLPIAPAQAVKPDEDLRNWKAIGNEHYDHMYTDVTLENGWSTVAYQDEGTNLQVQLKADDNFHDWVIYTPDDRPSIALEPYTCAPNAINLAAENIKVETDNVIRLKAGASWQTAIVMQIISDD